MGVYLLGNNRYENEFAGRPVLARDPETGESFRAVCIAPMRWRTEWNEDGKGGKVKNLEPGEPTATYMVEMLDINPEWLEDAEAAGVRYLPGLNYYPVICYIPTEDLTFTDEPTLPDSI